MKFFAPIVLLITAAVLPVAAATQNDGDLLKSLVAANERSVDAWRSHDRTAFASAFTPDSVYLSSDGIFKLSDILDGLMSCTVGEISYRNQQVRSISPTSAVLISRQHQDVHCGDHKEPSELNSTITFVQRNGQWLVLLRTDTPAVR